MNRLIALPCALVLVPTLACAQALQIDIADGITGHGSMSLVPTLFGASNSPAILNTTPGQPLYFAHTTRTGTDAGDFECRRVADYTGGTFGFVNPCFTSYTTVNAGTTSFEWSFLARLDNNGTQADASQNVAAYFQGRKLSTGSTWGAVTELYDVTANPTTGSVTDEHDMTATGTDNNDARVLFDGWVRNVSGTSPVEAAYGIRLNTDTGGLWKHGIYFNGAYGDGINLSNGTYTSAALALGAGHKLCMDGATCANYLTQASGQMHLWAGGSDAMQIGALGTNVIAINSGGQVTLPSSAKLCLDGTTCSNYATQAGGQWHIWAAGSDSMQIGALGTNVVALNSGGQLTLPSSAKLCLDGTTCANYLTQSGGTLSLFAGGSSSASFTSSSNNLGIISALSLNSSGSIAGASLSAGSGSISGGNITGSGTVQGATVTSAGNVVLPSSGKLCLNGAACSISMTFSGTSIAFLNGGTLEAAINMSTGQVQANTGYTAGVGVGVSCSGSPSASFASVGGIVTHC